MAAQKYFTLHPSPSTLPEEAYIMMGDHVAYALQACARRGFMRPVVACQFAKMLKIACGYENTHAAASELDLSVLLSWAEKAGISPEFIAIISQANTAREIAVASEFDHSLMEIVADKAGKSSSLHAPGIKIHPLLCRYDGTVAL
jgi:cobalt-precorrin-5B (C1)-methyltransferase